MLRLLPKEKKFFEMFLNAAENIQAAAKLLKEMLESGENPDHYAREIKELEHSGDKMIHEIINKLNKTFVTLFDREDIYDLCRALDDVLDHIDSAAHRIIIYRITNTGQNAIRLAQIIIKCSDEITQAIGNLQQIDMVKLKPAHGFTTEISASAAIIIATLLGAPTSTTHVISTSIMGVGTTQRLSSVRWGVAFHIILTWILTFPGAALIAGLFYILIRAII